MFIKIAKKKPKKLNHFRYVEIEELPLKEAPDGVTFIPVAIDLPENIPDLTYKLHKVVAGVENRVETPFVDQGRIRFMPKGWCAVEGDNSKLEIGHSLYISNPSTYYHTSVIREFFDYGDHFIFKTSSGTTYKLVPQSRSQDFFLSLRGIKN